MQKIKRNAQVTLPKNIREIAGLKEGDFVEFSIKGNQIVLNTIDVKTSVRTLPSPH